MDAAEIEFLAEKTPISIIPNFTQEKLYLISGDVGPFAPGEAFRNIFIHFLIQYTFALMNLVFIHMISVFICLSLS